MTNDKKIAGSLLALGLLVGGTSAIAFQSHAQSQDPTPALTTPSVALQGDIATPKDTDNIQDKDGIEKSDSLDQKDEESNDQLENDKDDTAQSSDKAGESEQNDTDGGANDAAD